MVTKILIGTKVRKPFIYSKKAPDVRSGAAMKRMEKLLLDSKSFLKVLQLYIRY
jgi:hypothetical protein